MNNKEAIINKIIENANISAQSILDEANKNKLEILNKAKKEAKEYRQETFPSSQKYIDELVERGKILSNLEAKKIILAKKKELIKEVFKLAVQELKTKSLLKYKKLISNMIENNSEKGDTIQFSFADKKIFDKKFLEDLSKKIKKELKFNEVYGSFEGGVLITNKSCDRNLTLEVELVNLLEEKEKEIAQLIFEEK